MEWNLNINSTQHPLYFDLLSIYYSSSEAHLMVRQSCLSRLSLAPFNQMLSRFWQWLNALGYYGTLLMYLWWCCVHKPTVSSSVVYNHSRRLHHLGLCKFTLWSSRNEKISEWWIPHNVFSLLSGSWLYSHVYGDAGVNKLTALPVIEEYSTFNYVQ